MQRCPAGFQNHRIRANVARLICTPVDEYASNKLQSFAVKATNESVLSFYSSAAISIVVAVLHYLMSGVAIQFADVFEGFGAELPLLTQFMLPGSVFYWFMPVLILLVFLAHHLGQIKRRVALILGSVLTVASMILCTFGLYLPIIQLGAAAG